jgi:hypothetical protein
VLLGSLRFPGDSHFGEPALIRESENELPLFDVALDDLGNAVVVWSEQVEGVPSAMARRYDAQDGVFGAPSLLEQSDAKVEGILVGMSPEGDALVAYWDINGALAATRFR